MNVVDLVRKDQLSFAPASVSLADVGDRGFLQGQGAEARQENQEPEKLCAYATLLPHVELQGL